MLIWYLYENRNLTLFWKLSFNKGQDHIRDLWSPSDSFPWKLIVWLRRHSVLPVTLWDIKKSSPPLPVPHLPLSGSMPPLCLRGGRYMAKAKPKATTEDFVNLSGFCSSKASAHRRVQRSSGAGEDLNLGETGSGLFLLRNHGVPSGWEKEREAEASGPGPERQGCRVGVDGTRARHRLEGPAKPSGHVCACVWEWIWPLAFWAI